MENEDNKVTEKEKEKELEEKIRILEEREKEMDRKAQYERATEILISKGVPGEFAMFIPCMENEDEFEQAVNDMARMLNDYMMTVLTAQEGIKFMGRVTLPSLEDGEEERKRSKLRELYYSRKRR